MNKIISIVLFLVMGVLVLSWILFWLVTTPNTPSLQPVLEERTNFNYTTSLIVQKDSFLREELLLRRVQDSIWQTSGPHTDYQVQTREEPSMAVSTIRPDASLKKSTDGPSRIIIGRLKDRGSGMHGWHVTMIRQGDSKIDFNRHQRYYVWIEKEFPQGFNNQGEPTTDDPKRWFFAGLADIIAKEKYNGNVDPAEGDR